MLGVQNARTRKQNNAIQHTETEHENILPTCPSRHLQLSFSKIFLHQAYQTDQSHHLEKKGDYIKQFLLKWKVAKATRQMGFSGWMWVCVCAVQKMQKYLFPLSN